LVILPRKINRLFAGLTNVWIKFERAESWHSIKRQNLCHLIEDAEKKGLSEKTASLSTTSKYRIGLAMVAATKGYQLILVMPESMSVKEGN
jgi:cysteine synthase A